MASIDILSADVLLHIFEYLDSKSLKNSALVCKFWNDVISDSSRITRNFTLNLSVYTKWITKFEEIMSLKRRFQSMSITLHSSSHPYIQEPWTDNAIRLLLQIIEKHGASVRKLILKHAEFEDTKDFCSVLSQMPLLHELTLHRVKFNAEQNYTNKEQTMLSKLNKLTINTCDWNIFKLFMTSPIKQLLISNKFSLIDVSQRTAYMKFLEASAKLESIEFDLTSYSKTFESRMDSNICFKLKRLKYLSMSPSYDEINEIDKNFGALMESQASSLTELDLNYVSPNNIKTIFTKLKHLEKLRLNTVVLPSNAEFYASFKSMPHLKTLRLHDTIPSEVAVKGILVNCCNLETLTAHHDSSHCIPNLLTFVAANNPMLKNLSIDALSVPISLEAKFNHLKYLHIETCNKLENVVAFLTNNVAVETLSLNLADEIVPDDEIWEALLNLANLQHLILAAKGIKLNGVYNKIKSDYRKLRSLELRPITKTADKVFIKFPNDKSEWQPSDYNFR